MYFGQGFLKIACYSTVVEFPLNLRKDSVEHFFHRPRARLSGKFNMRDIFIQFIEPLGLQNRKILMYRADA